MLYLGGLSYGGLSIYNSVTERRALADREFDSLARLVSSTGAAGFMDEPFIQTVQDAIDGSVTLLGTVITGSRGEFAFEREPGTVIEWVNDSPRFVSRFAVTNPPKYLPLQITGQRNANIYAVSGYLDYDFCITILKRTLLIVLFSLALAFFTLLMDALVARNRLQDSPEIPGVKDEDSGPSQEKAAATVGSAKTAKIVETAETAEEPSRIPDDWTDDDDDDEPDFDFDGGLPEEDTEGLSDIPEQENPGETSEEAPASAFAAPAFTAAAPEAVPQGLYTPRGNIGWESYTEDRLDSELHRCASAEQDLALIIATVKEPENLSSEQFRPFCQEAVQFFEHRDLIFEYRKQGISIICPNISLEQAFARSEEFNNRVLGKLSRPAGSRIDLRFGISSRSGRLIDAKQIVLEAGEALERAAGDLSSHIVAFKSDPEKYRQYIGKRR
jgi:hypothetical protein